MAHFQELTKEVFKQKKVQKNIINISDGCVYRGVAKWISLYKKRLGWIKTVVVIIKLICGKWHRKGAKTNCVVLAHF